MIDIAGTARFREAAGIPADAAVVGLIAAHRREKRHDSFVGQIQDQNAMGLEVWGCMAGELLLEANREMALRSVCADRLVVTGPLSDLRGAYSGVDLVVLLSDDVEAFPLCFLEAQAGARAVVGMDTGGVGETFLPGRSGVLVAQADQRQMASEVAELLGDQDKLRAMGATGRQWVDANLSLEKMIDGYEALLERVAAGRRL